MRESGTVCLKKQDFTLKIGTTLTAIVLIEIHYYNDITHSLMLSPLYAYSSGTNDSDKTNVCMSLMPSPFSLFV